MKTQAENVLSVFGIYAAEWLLSGLWTLELETGNSIADIVVIEASGVDFLAEFLSKESAEILSKSTNPRHRQGFAHWRRPESNPRPIILAARCLHSLCECILNMNRDGFSSDRSIL